MIEFIHKYCITAVRAVSFDGARYILTENKMEKRFLRSEMLLGEACFNKLRSSRAAVFGIGGVGGYAAEALVRTGIGAIDIIDKDVIDETNINRQIIADTKTVGLDKVAVMRERLLTINPGLKINAVKMFYLPETADELDLSAYDVIIDAVDNVTAKLELITRASEMNVPVISSMGTGNKLHPELLEVSDIYSTSVCPLARVMRRELKKRGVKSLRVVYSKEEPQKGVIDENGRHAPASAVFVPASAGLLLAAESVQIICGLKQYEFKEIRI